VDSQALLEQLLRQRALQRIAAAQRGFGYLCPTNGFVHYRSKETFSMIEQEMTSASSHFALL